MGIQASVLKCAVVLAAGYGRMTAVYNLLKLLAARHPGLLLRACSGSWDHLRGKASEMLSGVSRLKVVPLPGFYNQSFNTKLTLNYQPGAAEVQ